ncbi:MAG: hypothetical protein BWY70_01870 [Bacteroidetes bacterium ADurb.Bin408]|nr:MAG: hypothetical protein BWY70_01870 [Bacteroidetes bacterium ADurb.Bin408]
MVIAFVESAEYGFKVFEIYFMDDIINNYVAAIVPVEDKIVEQGVKVNKKSGQKGCQDIEVIVVFFKPEVFIFLKRQLFNCLF